MLAELSRIGVPAERIRLVFNLVEDTDAIDSVFETLLAYCAATNTVVPRLAACLQYNEIYTLARSSDRSLTLLAADTTDYKAEILKAESMPDKLAFARKLAIQRLAQGVIPELDACFAALELPGFALSES